MLVGRQSQSHGAGAVAESSYLMCKLQVERDRQIDRQTDWAWQFVNPTISGPKVLSFSI